MIKNTRVSLAYLITKLQIVGHGIVFSVCTSNLVVPDLRQTKTNWQKANWGQLAMTISTSWAVTNIYQLFFYIISMHIPTRWHSMHQCCVFFFKQQALSFSFRQDYTNPNIHIINVPTNMYFCMYRRHVTCSL